MAEKLGFKENMIWNSIGNIVYLGCQWLLTYITTRLLGYESAGIFSLAMTISGSLSNIALYAMRNYQTSDVTHAFSNVTYITSRLLTSAIAFIVCLAFLGINKYDPYAFSCIAAYMAFKIAEAMSDVYQGVLQREMRMDYIGKSFIIKGIIGLAGFTLCIAVFNSLLPGILALFSITLLVTLFYDRVHAARISNENNITRTTCSSVLKLLKVCLPLALFGLLFNTMGQAPRYFLEAKLGTESLGFYASVAMPVTIVQVSASFLFSPLTTPLAERLAKRDRNGFKSLIARVLISVSVLAIAAIILFALFGDFALCLLFGDSIAPYTNLLLPLVMSGVLLAFSWFLSTIVTVMRRLRPLLAASAISFVVVLGCSSLMIDMFGMNGATYIVLIAMMCFIAAMALIIGNYFNDESNWINQAGI